MFGADAYLMRPDSGDRRQKPERTSRLSKNLKVKTQDLFIKTHFPIYGMVFSLTTEGHIEVGVLFRFSEHCLNCAIVDKNNK